MKRAVLIAALALASTPIVSLAVDAYPMTTICELFTAVG